MAIPIDQITSGVFIKELNPLNENSSLSQSDEFAMYHYEDGIENTIKASIPKLIDKIGITLGNNNQLIAAWNSSAMIPYYPITSIQDLNNITKVQSLSIKKGGTGTTNGTVGGWTNDVPAKVNLSSENFAYINSNSDITLITPLQLGVSGILDISHGGTGASSISDARENLNVVNKAGDTMTGNLTIGTVNTEGLSALYLQNQNRSINFRNQANSNRGLWDSSWSDNGAWILRWDDKTAHFYGNASSATEANTITTILPRSKGGTGTSSSTGIKFSKTIGLTNTSSSISHSGDGILIIIGTPNLASPRQSFCIPVSQIPTSATAYAIANTAESVSFSLKRNSNDISITNIQSSTKKGGLYNAYIMV